MRGLLDRASRSAGGDNDPVGDRPPYFFPRRPNRDIRRLSLLRISSLASEAILPTVSSVLMTPSSSSVGRTGPPRATVSAACAR